MSHCAFLSEEVVDKDLHKRPRRVCSECNDTPQASNWKEEFEPIGFQGGFDSTEVGAED